MQKKPPIWQFLPRTGKIGSSWWSFNEEAIIKILELFGFEKSTINYHDYRDANGKKVFQWTLIAERTVPIDQCDYDVDPQ